MISTPVATELNTAVTAELIVNAAAELIAATAELPLLLNFHLHRCWIKRRCRRWIDCRHCFLNCHCPTAIDAELIAATAAEFPPLSLLNYTPLNQKMSLLLNWLPQLLNCQHRHKLGTVGRYSWDEMIDTHQVHALWLFWYFAFILVKLLHKITDSVSMKDKVTNSIDMCNSLALEKQIEVGVCYLMLIKLECYLLCCVLCCSLYCFWFDM